MKITQWEFMLIKAIIKTSVIPKRYKEMNRYQ